MNEKEYGLNDIVEMKKNILAINQNNGRSFVWVRIFESNV